MKGHSLPAYLLRFVLLILLYEVLAMVFIPAVNVFVPGRSPETNPMMAQTIAALITNICAGYVYLKETAGERQNITGHRAFIIGISGIIVGVTGNLIINLTVLPDMSGAFKNASKVLFSPSLPIQIISLCLVIPLCEELLYRGFLQRYLKLFVGSVPAILVSSVIFALLHGNIVQGIYALVIGMIMGCIFEKYENIMAPYIFHCMANFSALILGLLCN